MFTLSLLHVTFRNRTQSMFSDVKKLSKTVVLGIFNDVCTVGGSVGETLQAHAI